MNCIHTLRPERSVRHVAAIAACLLSASVWATDDDWPTWRGPGMTGIAPDADPPVTFSETQNLKWKVRVPGSGHASPVIRNNRIFLLTAIPQGDEKPEEPAPAGRRNPFGSRTPTIEYAFDILCIDRNTGETLWQKTATKEKPHEGHHRDHGFASGSAVTDGTHVWAFFGSRGLHCYDINGNHAWSRDLGDLKTRMSFGEGSSPALAGGNVIVVMDHEGDSFIAALDKTTGQERWRQARDERTSWTTPLPITRNGQTEVVVSGSNRTRSYNPRTGEILWECGGQTQNAVPTPMTGFGMVFCTSGFRGNALQAIKLGHSGDLTGTDAVAWELDRNTPYVPSPLLYDDLLYLLSHNKPKLNCVNAQTGEELYTDQTIEGMHSVYASPVGAAGRIYIAGRKGKVAVIKHGPAFELLALNALDEGIDASPAIVGNSLYLRGAQSLYCFEK